MLKDFNESVIQTDEKVLVKFGAPWCSSCVQIEPILEDIQKEGYNVFTVNTDKDPESTVKYQIRSVPTILIFEKGEIVQTFHGTQTKSTLIKSMEK